MKNYFLISLFFIILGSVSLQAMNPQDASRCDLIEQRSVQQQVEVLPDDEETDDEEDVEDDDTTDNYVQQHPEVNYERLETKYKMGKFGELFFRNPISLENLKKAKQVIKQFIINPEQEVSFEAMHVIITTLVKNRFIEAYLSKTYYPEVALYFVDSNCEEIRKLCDNNAESYLNYFLSYCWVENNENPLPQDYVSFYNYEIFITLSSAAQRNIREYANQKAKTSGYSLVLSEHVCSASSMRPWKAKMIKFLEEHPRAHFAATAALSGTATLAWCAPYFYKNDSFNKAKLTGILGAGIVTTGLTYYLKEKFVPKRLLGSAWSSLKEQQALITGTGLVFTLCAGIKYLPLKNAKDFLQSFI